MIGSIPVGMPCYKKNNKKNNEYSEQWRLSWSATATIYILPIAAASSLQDCSSRCRLASFWFLHCLGMVNRVFFYRAFDFCFLVTALTFSSLLFADSRSEDMMAVTGHRLILPHSHCGPAHFHSGTGSGFFVNSSIILANCTNWCNGASSSWQHCRSLPRMSAASCKGYNKRCVFLRLACEALIAKKGELRFFCFT